MNKEGKCCFCGKDYFEYGKSTWGVWKAQEEKLGWGENKRCCNECNEMIVVPARKKKAQALKDGIISSVKADIPEVIFGATFRSTEDFKGQTLRLYENGIYEKIEYGEAETPEESEQIKTIIGSNPVAADKVLELFKKHNPLSFIDYVNESEEIINPYDDTVCTIFCCGKYSFTGKGFFTIFPDEKLKELSKNSSEEELRAYKKVRIINRYKCEMIMLLRQLFGIEKE